LRLSLFFFDEKVTQATLALNYLNQDQGTSFEKMVDEYQIFDFGKSKESIKREREC
jgi:hypothetical protein